MRSVLISLLISILVAGAAFLWLRAHPESFAGAAKPENTYERILRTGEIRCGYSLWEPLFTIDPKTGEKRGIFYDLMEEAGKRLGFKIIWQEELGWGTIVESVISHRVDMACTAYWLNAGRLKSASSSVPQLYTPLYVWVRQDEARPFASPDDLNSPALTVTSIDGAADNQVIAERFAKAKHFALSEMTSSSDQIEAVVTGKADFAFMDEMSADAYIANNPGKIRNLFPGQPIVIFPTVLLLPPDDPRLKEVIDDILLNMEYDGTLDAILKKYHMENGFLRNPKPALPPE